MDQELLTWFLRNPDCTGCPRAKECEGREAGCVVTEAAADLIEAQQAQIAQLKQANSAQRRADFCLGQMDMKEAVMQMLQEASGCTYGLMRSALLIAAGVVRDMEPLR